MANDKLLVMRRIRDLEDFAERKHIIALPLDDGGRAAWDDYDDCYLQDLNVRLEVLGGVPIILHWFWNSGWKERAVLYMDMQMELIRRELIEDLKTAVVWNDRLFLCGEDVRVWQPTGWSLGPPLCRAVNSGRALVTAVGLFVLGGRTSKGVHSTWMQWLPSMEAEAWICLECQLPAGGLDCNAWYVNGRLYFATNNDWGSNPCWSLPILAPREVRTSDWIQEPNIPGSFSNVFTV